jgi:S1-C subfamily serine protease
MSRKKSTPLKKSSLCKLLLSKLSSLRNLLKNIKIKLPSKRLIKDVTEAALLVTLMVATMGYMMVKGPEIHGQYLRSKVGSKVYMIKGKMNGGGGTGFSLRAPSGTTYVVTNSHICEYVRKDSEDGQSVLVIDDELVMRRRIVAISDKTDLCLIEGLPGVDGLSLGDAPSIGEVVATIGHPRLRPLSISRGEIVGFQDVQIFDYVMKSGNDKLDEMFDAKDGACDMPKNKIEHQHVTISMFGIPLAEVDVNICTIVTKNTYMSTVTIYGGNSGSPVVNFFGNVIGVMFATDDTNWGFIVSNQDLRNFISKY